MLVTGKFAYYDDAVTRILLARISATLPTWYSVPGKASDEVSVVVK